jgi:hypothetical protein
VDRRAALVALLAALLLGCQQTFHEMTDPYLGTWQITSGEDMATCMSGATSTSPVMGSVIVATGAQALRLQVRDTNHGTCVWTLAVSGVNATLKDGPTCASTTGTSTAMVAPRAYTMTLAPPNGATVDSTFDWTILQDTCRHMQHETLVFMQEP